MAGKKKKKKEKKKRPGVWKFFEIKGEKLERKCKTCPKCGEGFFMAQHKERLYCGKCHYTEFLKKK